MTSEQEEVRSAFHKREGDEATSTLVDFITHVKKVEYILSLFGIAVFLLFWEFPKPTPFRSVTNTGREDLKYIEQRGGFRHVVTDVGRIAAAPFIGLAHIAMLPIGFFVVLAAAAVNLVVKEVSRIAGKSATFEWRPVEAYLAGRKKKKGKKAKKRPGGQ